MAGGSNLNLALRIQADLGDARERLRRLQDDVRGLAGAAGKVPSQPTVDLGRAAQGASGQVQKLASTLTLAAQAGAGLFALGMVRRLVGSFADVSSGATDLAARLERVAGSSAAASQIMERLREMARRTYSDFAGTAETFLGMSGSLQELGYSAGEQLNFVESLNNALVVSGAKAERAAQVQDALTKAMALGTLQGVNLNTVIQTGGRVAELLAKELGVGVNQLRAVGEQGKITGDVIYNALAGNLQRTREEAAAMPATINDALLLLGDAFKQLTADAGELTGASRTTAGTIEALAAGVREGSAVLHAMRGSADELSGSLERTSIIQEGFGVLMETLAVLGTNTMYVLRAIGREIGGLAAQAASLARLDFAGAQVIHAEMVRDAEAARRAVDETTARILSAREKARAAAARPDAPIAGAAPGKSPMQRQAEADAAALDKLRDKLSGIPGDYRETMAEIIRLNKQGVLTGKEYTDALASMQAKLVKPHAARAARKDPAESAFASQQQSLTQALAQAQQQLANAQAGVAGATDNQTTRLEAWLKTNASAGKMTAAQVAKLRELARATDAASAATRNATEGAARRTRIEDAMPQVDAAIAQAEGRAADAAAAQAVARWRKLREDLQAEGDRGGLLKIDRLIDMDQARARLQALQQQAQAILGGQSQQEQTVQTALQAGLTTEYDARQRLLTLHAATAQQLTAMLPTMRALAESAKDPALLQQVEAIAARAAELKTQVNELGIAFGNTFQGSFSSALEGLATRTKTLGEAVRGFLSDMAAGMAKWAADKLAAQAQSAIMGLVTNGASKLAGLGADAAGGAAGGAAQAAAISGASATGAAALGAGVTAGSTTGAGILTGALAGAFAAGAAQLAGAIASASLAGAGGRIGGSLSGMLGSLAGATQSGAAFSFATGGYTGPGTMYQPAGIVHAGEWVLPQRVVNQPGAKPFLAALQRHGMSVLGSLRGLRGYATGGLVAPAAMPAYRPTEGPAGGSGSTTLNNRLALNLIDDPERIAGVLRSPQGEKAFTVLLSRNPQKFRQLLGVGGT